ncbi:DMT family transporter [Geminicoccus roseus]|uniref:DMT family transporter n=1 Tax=Geminicoccus roseus TaxID=404900 RepID=UPI0004045448|nr:DMT family transporter [Geminicoccus roseus]
MGKPDKDALVGVGLLLLAFSILPILDGIAKIMGERFHPMHITWGRYVFNMLVLLPIVAPRFGWRMFAPPRLGLQVIRGACLLAATMLFFTALMYLTMAETLALAFVYPLIVTIAAPWVLGERLSAAKLVAAVVGLCGAILIIRPGAAVFQPASLLAFSTAFVFSVYIMLTRKLAGLAPHLQSLFFTAFVGTVVMTPIAPFVWNHLSWLDWLGFAAIGTIAATGHLIILRAYERAPASVLAPLGYFEIVSTVALGWLLFDDLPDAWTWAGIVVIVASGIFVTVWTSQREKAAEAPPPVTRTDGQAAAG